MFAASYRSAHGGIFWPMIAHRSHYIECVLVVNSSDPGWLLTCNLHEPIDICAGAEHMPHTMLNVVEILINFMVTRTSHRALSTPLRRMVYVTYGLNHRSSQPAQLLPSCFATAPIPNRGHTCGLYRTGSIIVHKGPTKPGAACLFQECERDYEW